MAVIALSGQKTSWQFIAMTATVAVWLPHSAAKTTGIVPEEEVMDWSPIRQVDDVINKFGTEERIKRFQSGELVLVERNEAQKRGAILTFERNVSIVARRFVAGESFTKSNTKVKFGHIDERLEKLFGKIREDVSAGELAVHALLQNAYDPDIMAAIQPHSRRFIKLGQFYQLLEAQGHGQEGPLLVNGCANIGYVLDENGAAWAVGAHWHPYDGGWYVDVFSVAYLYVWYAGYRVLSQVA